MAIKKIRMNLEARTEIITFVTMNVSRKRFVNWDTINNSALYHLVFKCGHESYLGLPADIHSLVAKQIEKLKLIECPACTRGAINTEWITAEQDDSIPPKPINISQQILD